MYTDLPLKTADETQLRATMQTGTTAQKIKIVEHFLGVLQGCYSLCQLKYTTKPEDKNEYEKNYKVAKFYLDFLEQHCASWINSEEAPKTIKTTYSNYTFYAKRYLHEECLPPHPSVHITTSGKK